MENRKRVVVGMSGGVDSSVAAYLLQEQGFEVIGLFMKNWHDDSVTISNECPWLEDSNDAVIVADMLGIPFQTIDLSVQYKERIVDYMFSEYQSGRTPNPDILCNREIKFDIFLKACLELKADYVATGHYCRKEEEQIEGKTIYKLLAGKDDNKDQSYFLCQLNQEQLSKALFPIGDLTKPQVRAIADKIGLVNAQKKDSQGLCFIGKVKLPTFLQQQLAPKTGKVIEIDPALPKLLQEIDRNNIQKCCQKTIFHKQHGQIIGEHNGAHYYTIGQRKGLNIGGKKEPLFVLDKDIDENLIFVGQGAEHPGLLRFGLKVETEDIHWLRTDLTLNIDQSEVYDVRFRYRQDLQKATLHLQSDGLYVVFDQIQSGIASGQFVAWYIKDQLIGSGVISNY
jgi:tRNA-specific 2-thiouridylase